MMSTFSVYTVVLRDKDEMQKNLGSIFTLRNGDTERDTMHYHDHRSIKNIFRKY